MANSTNEKQDFLLNEYSSLQKYYEVQFNHFMGVFYLWSGVLGTGIAASFLSNIELSATQKSVTFGVTLLMTALLGIFISLKMFDIRHSQFRYIKKLNEMRVSFWKKYNLSDEGLTPLSGDINLSETAKKDFGIYMACAMSLIHGALVFFGIYAITSSTYCILVIALVVGLIIVILNIFGYYRIVVRSLMKSEKDKS